MDLQVLEPFINNPDEGLLKWVLYTMKDLRKRATGQEIAVAKWMWSQRIVFVSQSPFLMPQTFSEYQCYFADFYIPALDTIIEVDGSHHYTENGLEYDRLRDMEFASIGIKTIRIKNSEVASGRFKSKIPIPDEPYLRQPKVLYADENMRLMSRKQKIAYAKQVLGYLK